MTTNDTFLKLNAKIDAEKILWIQGPGGNTSLKVQNNLLVKASGTRIREIRAIDQFAKLNISGLRNNLHTLNKADNPESAYSLAIERNTIAESPRPSMESGFHAWLPSTFIFHIHSLIGICMAEIASGHNAEKFRKWYTKLWKATLGPMQIIKPSLPGYELTRLISEQKPASIYWLRNHGVILAFDQIDFIQTYQLFELACIEKFMPEALPMVMNWKQLDPFQIIQKQPQLLEARLHFYFPDMAILYPRIGKFLIPSINGNFRFNADQPQVDQDALENWLASSMLQRLMPDLPALPEAVCSEIPNLPTEIERKKMMEPKS